LGLSYRQIEAKGVFLPVSEAHCKFFSPVRYDDLLVIETELDARVKAGIKFDYRIHREEDRKRVAEGFTKHPCVNESGKVIRPPTFLNNIFPGF
jgi:acyl-CoA thioester hydrolase